MEACVYKKKHRKVKTAATIEENSSKKLLFEKRQKKTSFKISLLFCK